MISIKDLSKSYGSKVVLENINLNFEKGKVYGIVGENGSGKTTLFKCIAGIEKHKGAILCEYGKPKDFLGYLQTEPYFFSKITGNEYIQLLCNARNVTNTDIKEKNIFDLPLNEYAVKYSTGMRKKLAFTAILLQENKLFILDEPFNGVDFEGVHILYDIIGNLKSENKIVIVSSHIIETLFHTCDKIAILQNGQIEKIYEKSEYEQLQNFKF